MQLGALFQGVEGERHGRFDAQRVRALVTDSRRVRAGSVFFALAGTNGHGLHHVEDAIGRGALALVAPCAPTAALRAGLPTLVVENPRSLLAPLAARLYGRPADRLMLFGVTGTNGKTTTALMTAAALARADVPTAYWTTTEVRVGDIAFRPFWTTPPPPDLERFLAACVDVGASRAVLEVSSHAVALGRIEGLRFAVGAATNLSPDHLDFHGTVEAYAAAKRRFIQDLDADAVAVLNGDDPVVSAFGQGARARVVRVGWEHGADLRLTAFEDRREGFSVHVEIGPEELRPGGERAIRLDLPVMGRHNAMNAVVALAAVLAQGLDATAALAALARFTPPLRRLERRDVGPYTIVNDVAMNEASFETVLAWAAASGHEQVVTVYALRGHRGAAVTAAIGRVFVRHVADLDLHPLHVSLSRSEMADLEVDQQVRDLELDAFLAVLAEAGVAAEVGLSLGATIDRAVARLDPGGLLLLLGTFGMDDGPRLAEAALCRRLGLPPTPALPYPPPSYGHFPGEPGGAG